MNILVIATLVAVAYSLPTSLDSNEDHTSEASILEVKKLENFELQSFEEVSLEAKSEETKDNDPLSLNSKHSSQNHESFKHPISLSSAIQSESDETPQERDSLETETSDAEGSFLKIFIEGMSAIRTMVERLERLASMFISKKSEDTTEKEEISNNPSVSKEISEIDTSDENFSKLDDSKELLLSKELNSKELDSIENISVSFEEEPDASLSVTVEEAKTHHSLHDSIEDFQLKEIININKHEDKAFSIEDSNETVLDISSELSSHLHKNEKIELVSIEDILDIEDITSREVHSNKDHHLQIAQSSSEEKIEIVTSQRIIKKLFGIIDNSHLKLKEDERLGNKYILDYSEENVSKEDSVEKHSVSLEKDNLSVESVNTHTTKESSAEESSLERTSQPSTSIESNEEFSLQSSEINNPSIQLELELRYEERSEEKDDTLNLSKKHSISLEDDLSLESVDTHITKDSSKEESSLERMNQPNTNIESKEDFSLQSSEINNPSIKLKLELKSEEKIDKNDETINLSISKELISQEITDKTITSSESFELLLKEIMNKVKQNNKTSTADSLENISDIHSERDSVENESKEIEFVAIIPLKSEFEPIIGVQAESKDVKFKQDNKHSVEKLSHTARGTGISLSEANKAVESLLTASQIDKLSERPLSLKPPQPSENVKHLGVFLEESNKEVEQTLLKSSSNFLSQYTIVDTFGLPLNENDVKLKASTSNIQRRLDNLSTETVAQSLDATKLNSNNPLQLGVSLDQANIKDSKVFGSIHESKNNILKPDINSEVDQSSGLLNKRVNSQSQPIVKITNPIQTQDSGSGKLSLSGISLDTANAAVQKQFESLANKAQSQNKKSLYHIKGFGKTLGEANSALRDSMINVGTSITTSFQTSSELSEIESSPEIADKDATQNFRALVNHDQSSRNLPEIEATNSSFSGSHKNDLQKNTKFTFSEAGVPKSTITPKTDSEAEIISSTISKPITFGIDGLPLSSANIAVQENFKNLVKIAQNQPQNSHFQIKGYGQPLEDANREYENSSTLAIRKELLNNPDSSNVFEHGVQLVSVIPQKEIETKISSATVPLPIAPIESGVPLSSVNIAKEENFESLIKTAGNQVQGSELLKNEGGKSLEDANAVLQNSAVTVESQEAPQESNVSSVLTHGVKLITATPPKEIETKIASITTHAPNTFVIHGLPLSSANKEEENLEILSKFTPEQTKNSQVQTNVHGKSLEDASATLENSTTRIESQGSSHDFDSSIIPIHGVELVTVTPQKDIKVETTSTTAHMPTNSIENGVPLSSANIAEEEHYKSFEVAKNQDENSELHGSGRGKSLEDANIVLKNSAITAGSQESLQDSNTSFVPTHGVQLITATQQIETKIDSTTTHAPITFVIHGLPLSSANNEKKENLESISKTTPEQTQNSQLQTIGHGKSLEDATVTLENSATKVESEGLSHDSNSFIISTHGVELVTVTPQKDTKTEITSATTHLPITSIENGLLLRSTNKAEEHSKNVKVTKDQDEDSKLQITESGKSLQDANAALENAAVSDKGQDSPQDLHSSPFPSHGVQLNTAIPLNEIETKINIATTQTPITFIIHGLPLGSENIAEKKNLENIIRTTEQVQNSQIRTNEHGKPLELAGATFETSTTRVESQDSSHDSDSSIISTHGVPLVTVIPQEESEAEINTSATHNPIVTKQKEIENKIDSATTYAPTNLIEDGVPLSSANRAEEENYENLSNLAQNRDQNSLSQANFNGKTLEDTNEALKNSAVIAESPDSSHDSDFSILTTNGVQLVTVTQQDEIETVTNSPSTDSPIVNSKVGLSLDFAKISEENVPNQFQASHLQTDGFGKSLEDEDRTLNNNESNNTSLDLVPSIASSHGVHLPSVTIQNNIEIDTTSPTSLNPITSSYAGIPLSSTNVLEKHFESFVNTNQNQNHDLLVNEIGKSLDDSAVGTPNKDSLHKSNDLEVSNTGVELPIVLSENNDFVNEFNTTTQRSTSEDSILEIGVPLEISTLATGINFEESDITLNDNQADSSKYFSEPISTIKSQENEVLLESENLAINKELENVHENIEIQASNETNELQKENLKGNENSAMTFSNTGVELSTFDTKNENKTESLSVFVTLNPVLTEDISDSGVLLDAVRSPGNIPSDISQSIFLQFGNSSEILTAEDKLNNSAISQIDSSKTENYETLTNSEQLGVSLIEANIAVNQNFESLKKDSHTLQKASPFYIKGFGKSLNEANNELLKFHDGIQNNQSFSNGSELREVSSVAESTTKQTYVFPIKNIVSSIKSPITGVSLERTNLNSKLEIKSVHKHSENIKHRSNKQVKGKGKSLESANRASLALRKPGRKILVSKKIKVVPESDTVTNGLHAAESFNAGVPLFEANAAVEKRFEGLVKVAQNQNRTPNSQYQVNGFGKSLEEANKETEETFRNHPIEASLQNSNFFSAHDAKINHEKAALPVEKTIIHTISKNGSPLIKTLSHTFNVHQVQSKSLEHNSSEELVSSDNEKPSFDDDIYDDVYDIIEELLEQQEERHSEELSKESIKDISRKELESKELHSNEAERVVISQHEKSSSALKSNVLSAKVSSEDLLSLEIVSKEELPSLEVVSKEEDLPSLELVSKEDLPSLETVSKEDLPSLEIVSKEEDLSSLETVSKEDLPSLEIVSKENLASLETVSKEEDLPSLETVSKEEDLPSLETVSKEDLPSLEIISKEDLRSLEIVSKEEDLPSLETVSKEDLPSLEIVSKEDLHSLETVSKEEDLPSLEIVSKEEELSSLEIVSKEDLNVSTFDFDSKSVEDTDLHSKEQEKVFISHSVISGIDDSQIKKELKLILEKELSSEDLEISTEISVENVSKEKESIIDYDDKSAEETHLESHEKDHHKDIASTEEIELHSIEGVSIEVLNDNVTHLDQDSKSVEDLESNLKDHIIPSHEVVFGKSLTHQSSIEIFSTEDLESSRESVDKILLEDISIEEPKTSDQVTISFDISSEEKLSKELVVTVEKEISVEDLENSSGTSEPHSLENISKEDVGSEDYNSKSTEDLLESKEQDLATSLQGLIFEISTSQPKKKLVTVIEMKAFSAEDFEISSEDKKVPSIEKISKEISDEIVSTLDFDSRSTEDTSFDSIEKDKVIAFKGIIPSVATDVQKEISSFIGLKDSESVEDINSRPNEDQIITTQHFAVQENHSNILHKEELLTDDLKTSSENTEVHSLNSNEQNISVENDSHEKKEKTNVENLSKEQSTQDKSDEDSLHSIETDLIQAENSTSEEKHGDSVESAVSDEDATNDDILEAKRIDDERKYYYPERGYAFEYKSEDGTERKELATRTKDSGLIEKEGEVSFTFPTGEDYKLSYTAGKEGYKPSSSWIPVAPVFPHPIPAFVLRQIDDARRKAEEEGSSEERSQQALRKAFNLS